jgi:CRP-like cAMP-binding protein
MEATQLIAELGRYVELTGEDAAAMLTRLRHEPFKKRDVLIEQGRAADRFLWVREGCRMAFHTSAHGQEHVMQFAVAHWWTTDLQSFVKGGESRLTIQALSDGYALSLSSTDFDELLDQHPVYERYFRKIFANALVVHQRRILRTIGADAEAHYTAYLNDYPGIEQWVPQKYIASYLGITPEFLSKLRRRMVKG